MLIVLSFLQDYSPMYISDNSMYGKFNHIIEIYIHVHIYIYTVYTM